MWVHQNWAIIVHFPVVGDSVWHDTVSCVYSDQILSSIGFNEMLHMVQMGMILVWYDTEQTGMCSKWSGTREKLGTLSGSVNGYYKRFPMSGHCPRI